MTAQTSQDGVDQRLIRAMSNPLRQRILLLLNKRVALPESVRRALFGQTLEQIWSHVADASRAGGLDDPQAHVSWIAPDLDEQGYADMVEHVNASLERAMEIEEESANRRAARGAGPDEASYRTELVLMHFHRS
jgi:hypothetical protein